MLVNLLERLVAFLEDIHTLSAEALNILKLKHLNKYCVNDISILMIHTNEASLNQFHRQMG